ncbi:MULTISPECIES: YjjG family noncanonical pyrimidine nucleotidase [Vagococcus]|uniref:5'-nucleotidase YjjG n=1 Tax=Vagococcus fluvialis bH819 TaxID=1255619 RepID=A0A1X6WMX4_9ENTE|nr:MULTISPECIES: YjjG family noncanonical pyrimidine nucleotidase [Vagococcus]SLM85582.1 5'-nucleotidase YjjG [Vagococcus fluvialis bH819]HCM89551.1 noncanonical pyrimidine nucleotidase, YjjG family [Vagococcus sp.]
MKKYEYLIFDLDNTLLNFSMSEYYALKALFTKYGVIFNEETLAEYKEINHELWTKLEEGRIKKEIVLETRFTKFFGRKGIVVDGKTADNDYRKLLESRNDIMKDAVELLTELKNSGYIIYAGTNGVGRTQRQRLKNAKMSSFFTELYISEEVGFEKPDVRFFDTIFNQEGITDLSKVLMIGDSLSSDIRGANRVGIDSVWLNNFSDTYGEDSPIYECNSLRQIKILLKK